MQFFRGFFVEGASLTGERGNTRPASSPPPPRYGTVKAYPGRGASRSAFRPRPKENCKLPVRPPPIRTDGSAMHADRRLSQLLPVRILRTVVSWAPVWAPLILIWQLTEGGLKPALKERSRLQAEMPAVVERNDRTGAEFRRLTAQRSAWDDPLFRERVLRKQANDALNEKLAGR